MDKNYIDANLDAVLERGVLRLGDSAPVKNFIGRIRSGEHVKLAFIGGSITQGCLASTEEEQYTRLVTKLVRERFGDTVEYINAPVGGTDSFFGVARVESEVLKYAPDLVVVEFSVNDWGDDFHRETYEGLVRRIQKSESHPAVILLFNYYFGERTSAQQVHLEVGEYYDLPCLSMKESFGALQDEGRLDWEDITKDGIHPNDFGHLMISRLFEKYFDALEKLPTPAGSETRDGSQLPSPLTANRFENCSLYKNYNCEPDMKGFTPDKVSVANTWYYFAGGWEGRGTGASVSFTFKGTYVAIQYKKYKDGNAPSAAAYIDGEELVPLNANFDQDWGDCLYLQMVSDELEEKEHTLTVVIKNEAKNPFYLVSVIAK